MNKILKKIVKEFSNMEISVKKNYKLFRIVQKVISPDFLNKHDYEDVFVSLDDRKIRCRLFEPINESKNLKVIIFIHGGGWVTGCLESYTKTCIELSKKTKRLVIAIDYRLAPEYPFPLGFNDCYDVINLIMNNLGNLGLKREDICLMGDSAGGNLVAAISLKSRATKDFKIKEQILLYPALQSDYSSNTKYKSVIENGKDYLLTQKQLQEYMELYMGDVKDIDSPYISPLNAKFPFFQPRTLIITADKDPLRDEGRCYAKKLKLFLNRVSYYNLEGAMHGFLSRNLEKNHKEEAYKEIIKFLGDGNE